MTYNPRQESSNQQFSAEAADIPLAPMAECDIGGTLYRSANDLEAKIEVADGGGQVRFSVSSRLLDKARKPPQEGEIKVAWSMSFRRAGCRFPSWRTPPSGSRAGLLAADCFRGGRTSFRTGRQDHRGQEAEGLDPGQGVAQVPAGIAQPRPSLQSGAGFRSPAAAVDLRKATAEGDDRSGLIAAIVVPIGRRKVRQKTA